MTFKERLLREYPGSIDPIFDGGCKGCPEDYGYEPERFCGGTFDCGECWNRECPDTEPNDSVNAQIAELEEALANQRKRADAAEQFICMMCAESKWEKHGEIVIMQKSCCKFSPLDCGKFKLRGVDNAPVEAPKTAENTLKVMLDPGAKMPTRAHDTDAGLDLYSTVDAIVFPRWRMGAKNSVVIDTGVHIAIPVGYVGDVKSKSGLMCNDDIITDGTVDSGYTGSIRVKLFNLGVKPVRIEAGQKIAQLVLKKIITPEIEVVDSLEESERGSGGFGSTGKF